METSNSTCSKSVADTLLDAALYIDTYGWCQGTFVEDVSGTLPRVCAIGAIHAALHGPNQEDDECGMRPVPAYSRAVNYFADFLDDGIYRDADDTPGEVVWKFNDHPNTTQQLVTYALRTAAKRARVELADQLVAS